MSRVFEELDSAGRSAAPAVHRSLHDRRGRRRSNALARLARLEEDVRILRRAAQHRPVGRQTAGAVRAHMLLGNHRPQVVVRQLFDLGDLVRGPETVEEVQERNPRARASRRARSRRNRGPPAPSRSTAWRSRSGGTPSRRSGRRRSTARGWPASRAATCMVKAVSSPAILYMLGIISSSPCDAVKVVRQRAGLKRAMHRARRARLRLHLDDVRHIAPEVLLALGSTIRRPVRPSPSSGVIG